MIYLERLRDAAAALMLKASISKGWVTLSCRVNPDRYDLLDLVLAEFDFIPQPGGGRDEGEQVWETTIPGAGKVDQIQVRFRALGPA